MSATHLRQDGRLEVADTEQANRQFGCTRDGWCILVDGHRGDCNEDRDVWPGPGVEYDE